jgi:hypothetical protein
MFFLSTYKEAKAFRSIIGVAKDSRDAKEKDADD